MTRGSNPTLKAITIDDMENSTSLDYASLFKTLKNLQDVGIKPTMKAQFAALENMFIQMMNDIIN